MKKSFVTVDAIAIASALPMQVAGNAVTDSIGTVLMEVATSCRGVSAVAVQSLRRKTYQHKEQSSTHMNLTMKCYFEINYVFVTAVVWVVIQIASGAVKHVHVPLTFTLYE